MEKKSLRIYGNYFTQWKLDGMSLAEIIAHFEYEFETLADEGVTDLKLEWDGEDFCVVGSRPETDEEYYKRVNKVAEMERLDKEKRLALYNQLKQEFGE